MKAIVLAGERLGGGKPVAAAGPAASVLVEVAAIPSIVRVIETLRGTPGIDGGIIAGPDASVCSGSETLGNLSAQGDYLWLQPGPGPAESIVRALDALDTHPILVTTGDHALLTPAIVAQFLGAAATANACAVAGLVPYERVARRFPGTRRTRLKFREGGFCGTNLFLLRNPDARGAVTFWARVQRDRKQPWKIARHLGLRTLTRYLLGRLAMDDAFATLSQLAECAVAWVEVDDERAAVDVDSLADLAIAEQILANSPNNQPHGAHRHG